MGYSLFIGEHATRSVAAMDEIRHDLFVLTMLDLVKDPHGQGYELARYGQVVERAVGLGSMGTIIYTVNDQDSSINIMDIHWPRPTGAR